MSLIEAHFRAHLGRFELDAKFSAPTGGVTALYGPSGCGKTTLLRCIAGLQRVHGQLCIGGETWQDDSTFVPVHRRGIGYVFQEPSLFPHLDVAGNIDYGYRRTPPAQRRVERAEAISLLGLAPLLRQRPETLSGGQRQRVAIARALLAGPRLLLMDEPLASLDLDSRAEILPLLERLRERLDIPMIYVSHAPAEVAQLADHLLLMRDGRITQAGPLNQLLTDPRLPPAQQEEASAVIEGTVCGHDDEFHLTRVTVAGGEMAVARRELPVGHRVRVRILARDVSLALEPPLRSSITNILPAHIVDIHAPPEGAQALVRLDLGGAVILARITRRSLSLLDLQPGQAVYAQVKSVALMHG